MGRHQLLWVSLSIFSSSESYAKSQKHLRKQKEGTQPTFRIEWHPSTTNLQFLYIRFFLELKEPHNRVFLPQNMPIYDFFYEPLYLNIAISPFSSIMTVIISLWLHLLISLVLFQYVYRAQSPIIWYVHLHRWEHCRVWDHDECISFYGLSLMLREFRLYKIVLISAWIYPF